MCVYIPMVADAALQEAGQAAHSAAPTGWQKDKLRPSPRPTSPRLVTGDFCHGCPKKATRQAEGDWILWFMNVYDIAN